MHKFFLTLSEIGPEMAAVELGVASIFVSFKSGISSHLPSFLLPCPYCGHRMAITAVTRARPGDSAESGDLEDITHGCVQCGTTLTRTVRPLVEDDRETALGA
jgi:hypothetical protein